MRAGCLAEERDAPSGLARRVRRATLACGVCIGLLVAPSTAWGRLAIFDGLDFAGLAAQDNEFFGSPPDTTGAVSREHYVETVNTRIAVYDRFAPQLGPLAERDASAFWGTQFAQVVDPQIAWDDRSGRFYYVALRNAETNGILVAWSRSSDPTDLENGWCKTEIQTGKLFDDFPKLGFSRNHLLIGTNAADIDERKILFSRIWAIAKPQSVEGGCDQPAIRALGRRREPLRGVDGKRSVTPVPAIPVGGPRRGYVVSAECIDDRSGEGLGHCPRSADAITVWHVSGPPDEPRLVHDGEIAVRRFRLPEPVPQRGTNRVLDASDTRLTQAVSNIDPGKGGRRLIWTQHTVAGHGAGSELRWYALDPKRLKVVRKASIAKRRRWVFNGAISPTRRGDAAVVNYNVGGPRMLPQIRARVAGRPRGELEIARSVAADTNCKAPPKDICTWGDYAGAVPDPSRQSVVWSANQTVAKRSRSGPARSHWRTRIFALRR